MRFGWIGGGVRSEYLYSCLKNDLKGASWLKTHPLSIIRDDSLVPLYVIEDSVESALPRILCGVRPGVTILTNYHFTYGGPEPIHNSPWKGIVRKREHKERGFWDPLFDWKNNGNVAEREVAVSGRVVFTSVEDRIASNSDSKYIPFPILMEDSLRIPNRSRSLLSCGGVSLEWRPEVFLLSSGLADRSIWLVDKHEIDQAKRLIAQYGVKNIELLSPRTPKNWREVLRSGGVCFFGLFSGYHSLSPYIEMSLAASLPVITTEYGKGKEYQFVYRVPPGVDEVRITQSILLELLKGESLRIAQDRHEYANDIFNAKSIALEIEFLVADLKPQDTWIAEEAREWVNKNACKEDYLKEAFMELGW
jgi:hypothetical protein